MAKGFSVSRSRASRRRKRKPAAHARIPRVQTESLSRGVEVEGEEGGGREEGNFLSDPRRIHVRETLIIRDGFNRRADATRGWKRDAMKNERSKREPSIWAR